MPVMKRLKERWGVGPWGVVVILVVFSLTGFTVVWLKTPILDLLLPDTTPAWVRWVVYPLIMLPLYQVILIGYGALLGQFSFFWEY